MVRFFVLIILLLAALYSNAQIKVVYSNSYSDIANPERGFYKHFETQSSNHSPLSVNTLQNLRVQQNITLILRLYYLNSFVNTDITTSFLNSIQADFNAIRSAGLKCIVRFAYSNKGISPYGDASKARVLSHLQQLKTVLVNNSDVIYLVQAGFIGSWGEWYYSDYFGNYPFTINNYLDRREVLDSLLNILPKEIMVQVRTPWYKRNLYNVSEPIPDSIAFNGSILSRIGYHNDCFLADFNDMGTFINPSIEYPYMQSETRFLPMGGESCQLFPSRSNCDTALKELSLFHWSYMNSGYHPDVLKVFENSGCMSEIKKLLGYRFVLQQGIYPENVTNGKKILINIELKNEGFASPFNPKIAYIILRHNSSGKEYSIPLKSEPRFWQPGIINITEYIPLPRDIQAGQYKLLFSIPDQASTLATNPKYSIQFANYSIWENTTGYNDLLHVINLEDKIALLDFYPKKGSIGDTIYLTGRKFSDVTSVEFGGAKAKMFSATSDTTMFAVIDSGNNGVLKIQNTTNADSLDGFVFCNLEAEIYKKGASEICVGEKVILYTPKQNGYSFIWFRNDSLLTNHLDTLFIYSGGNYRVVINDSNGCSDTSEIIEIKVKGTKPIKDTINGETKVIVNESKIYSVNNTTGSTYFWEVNNGVGNSMNNTITISWIKVGIDTLRVFEKNADGCFGDTIRKVIWVNTPTQIEERSIHTSESLLLYPNPSHGVVNLSVPEQNKDSKLSVSVMDSWGREIFPSIISKNSRSLQLSFIGFKSGIYSVKVLFEENLYKGQIVLLPW